MICGFIFLCVTELNVTQGPMIETVNSMMWFCLGLGEIKRQGHEGGQSERGA